MNTLIEKIEYEKSEIEFIDTFEFDMSKLSTYILDLSLHLEIRIKSLILYYEKNKEDTIEIISRITGMYQFSGTKIIQNFLYYICIHNISLSTFLKLECAKSLLSFTEYEEDIAKDDDANLVEVKTESNKQIRERNNARQELGYRALNNVCHIATNDTEFPTPCKIDAVHLLMETDMYKMEADSYFRSIINDQTIDCDYRYKTILNLEKKKVLNYTFYTRFACLNFLTDIDNKTMYRILAGQYLLQNYDDINKDDIYQTLYGFSIDVDLDYNLRADAADTLLTFGTEEVKSRAREVIHTLGQMGGGGLVKTIFDNAQNVHVKEIEKSVADILEVILMNKTIIVGENPIDFEFVKNKIDVMLKNEIITVKKKDNSVNTCVNCFVICKDEFCSENCKIFCFHFLFSKLDIRFS